MRDLANLSAAISAVEHFARATRPVPPPRERSWAELLKDGTDAEIMERARHDCIDFAPIVFASVYGGKRQGDREIVPHELERHPRRPVIMRGCHWALVAEYTWHSARCANGLARHIFHRWLRMRRATVFTHDEAEPLVYRFYEMLRKRPYKYRVTSRLDITTQCIVQEKSGDRGKHGVTIAGKFRYLTNEQFEYVRMLHGIIKKTERLDDRLALLRDARRTRAARGSDLRMAA